MRTLTENERKLIIESGLFDSAWYSKRFADVSMLGLDPLEHYFRIGIYARRDPGPLFSGRHYLERLNGRRQTDFPVLDYLHLGWHEQLNPHPLFDVGFYLDRNEDIRDAGLDPLRHFRYSGGLEGRQPHPAFPTHRVLERCPHLRESRRNPLEYYLSREWTEDPCPEATAYLSLCRAADPAQHSSVSLAKPLEHIPKEEMHAGAQVATDIRAIAIYLPQFHAIPENDAWWGKGFTEWANVRRATPQYEGHYQPHIPHPDLGHYDLNDASVLEKQAAMARAAGIEGFCFYYYWFNGRRLLNMPTDRLLATGKPDFPFCFCWANENWTRTWDGGDKEILIGQEHSDESDERFILDLLPAFRDPRYIRVDGKPLLIVYRPGLLPDPAATARHWRETCRREGIGEIFLARMQMFDWELEGRDPGYDTVIQFPPVSRGVSPNLKSSVRLHDSAKFTGEVRDYRLSAAHYPFENIGPALWPGVCPSWDNTARRMERGHSWIHSSPEIYHRWLSIVAHRARQALPPQQRFVFINAWNEWAEGCHLEPDEKFGYAWLNATRLALTDGVEKKITRHSQRPRVLVVGHDAFRAGAQIVLLTMLQEWRAHGQCDFQLVLLGDGVLRKEFEAVCPTLVVTDHATEAHQKRALEEFCRPVPDVILANTVVAGPFLPALKHLGVPIVAYIHELQKSIERWAPGPIMRATVENSDHFIAVSAPVANNLHRTHGIPADKISTLNPYIKTSHSVPPARLQALRAELGIQPHEKIIFGCGTVDWRKGPDLFVEAALEVLKRVHEARFFWMGGDTGDEAAARAHLLATDSRIRFLGERQNSRDYLDLGHAFFLSSREDPFPLVALEAADAGLPVICFAEAGGMPEFVGKTCGRTVPFEDTQAAAEALVGFLTQETLRQNTGLMAQASVRAKHDAARGSAAVFSILEGLLPTRKKTATAVASASLAPKGSLVSAIVPNFNYATYLPERLDSILAQTYRDFEILILDDASTDGSAEVIERYRRRHPDLIRVITNETNSGSPYPQWVRGIREARGELVWIAEADDSCEPDFLETLVPRFENPSIGIAYCQSLGLDGEGRVTRNDFLEHTEALHPDRWKFDYTEIGVREALDWMACRNTIPNASAALMRREVLLDLGDELLGYRSCGDWFLYLQILRKADVAYCARSLNKFRRHDRAVTRTTNQSEAYLAEVANIRRFVARIFPLHHSQLQRLDFFLDRDYVFEGIPRPSEHPATRPLLGQARQLTSGRLRLVFLSTNPGWGGSEILWNEAAITASNNGHDVIVITQARTPPINYATKLKKSGIKILTRRDSGYKSLRDFAPDLVVISTGNQDEGIEEFDLLSQHSIPYVVVSHLIKEEKWSPSLGEHHDSLVRDGLAKAQKLFFVSINNHRLMEHRLKTSLPNWEIVFNPLDIPPGEPIPMPDFSAGIRIAFPANILFIHKGHDLLLEVMAMEKWRQRPVTINLYGQGEDEEKVRQILAEREIRNVCLRGFIAPEEIWKINHAVLLASRMEGQSMAMIGAMIGGRVPIVTAVGGSDEVIQDNETGFLAATPSVADIDDALERAYQRRAEWPQIGIAARESALKLVPQNPVGDFVRVLDRICSNLKKVPQPAPEKGAAPVIKQDESMENRSLESFHENCKPLSSLNAPCIKTIAIHLPQFHPFKENNEWWGEGFTEWANVRKAQPLFPGHMQPRVPADLCYYDLRASEVRDTQAALARSHGIDGFCYYHYWFHGKRLMTEPMDAIFESGQPDFPFCLCWANETWSRRWLGEERDILIEQTYSLEDNKNHSRFLAKVFADRRYIRLNGRPLFIIYRPTHITMLAHFISTLRECSRAAGAGDPFLLGCSSHAEGTDMRTLGLDGTMDFQPKLGFLPEAFEDKSSPERLARNRAIGVDSPDLRLYDAKDFRQRIEDFRDKIDYPVHPSVFVSWDNTPRRGENGIVLLNNTPEDFAKSLESAKRYVNSPKFQGEKVVFINAWNEWAEGNYLEPDSSHGNKFLTFLKAQNIQAADIKTDSQHLNASHATQIKNRDEEFIKKEQGWCPICEKDAIFTARNAWLRDHYLCSGCGSIPRERAIMHVIQTRYPNWRELRIHESSPGCRGASVKLAKECKYYTASQYDPDLGFGNTHPSRGYRSENLEKQTFPDESFDIVVSQDVLEHIFDAEAAFRDIHRTLKPGGAHIFTTPLVNKEKPTQRRAELRHDGTIHHLFPPEYHGNPMSSEGSLVTFHWGFDIGEFAKKSSAEPIEILNTTDPRMGIEAEYIEVLLHKKQFTSVIAVDIDKLKKAHGVFALETSGNNTGNILFTNSVFSHLALSKNIGFNFYENICKINVHSNYVVIPAANWIIKSIDFGFLAEQLKQVTRPICCVGLGAQIKISETKDLHSGTIDFLKVLSQKSSLIGVRGKKTEEILKGMGIPNVLVVGCPSIFPKLQPITRLDLLPVQDKSRLSISFTRYSTKDPDPNSCQQKLAHLAAAFSDSIVLQSEEAEIRYLENPDAETVPWLCSYYNINESELPRLVSKLQFFNSQESWVQFHRDNTDFTISSRIHGCVASLLAGKPALLLAHDQRTTELAETMGIPQRPIECVANIQTKEDLLNLICGLDYTDFFAKQIINLEKLKHLYKTCGVATSI